MTNIEAAKAEQELFLNKTELDAIMMDIDMENLHDLNRRVGKVLCRLALEGKIQRGENDFAFRDAVSHEANFGKKPMPNNGKVRMFRRMAIGFATLADAFEIIENCVELRG